MRAVKPPLQTSASWHPFRGIDSLSQKMTYISKTKINS
jgi:hypothetical protein